ncbi:response regulator [Cohnella zeiphila]|uniref:Response regulator transcription factor n=1 Tax=Cohnella zeiphila TaxID=2761120 RepID=A0A7X0SSN6_9BACL|nr:response regulator [Cohnella zeiphila]MBB6734399.1 response regulator transcription factor [Cohnella zeiphila]
MFKVLIADDEYDIRQGLKQIIDWYEEGFVIVGVAEDGEEALELYERERPNLLITDIRMPGLNGLELARCVKEREPDAFIIILSGYDDFAYAKQAIQYGISSYLLKPVDEDELRGVLSKVKRALQAQWSSSYEQRKKDKWVHDYFFRKLVHGESIQKDIAETMKLQTLLERHYFRVLLVELDHYGEMLLELPESEIHLFRFAVRNILEDIVKTFSIGFVFEESEQRYGILLVGEDRQLSHASIEPLLRQIVDFTQVYAKMRVYVGTGMTVGHSQVIVRSYDKAKSALEQTFFQPEIQIYHGEAVQDFVPAWSLSWDAEKLKEAVKSGDHTNWEYGIESLFRELEDRSAPLGTIRNAIVYAILQLSRLVLAQEGDWNKLYRERCGNEDWMAKLKNHEDAKKKLLLLCEDVSKFILKTRETPPDVEIASVVQYVRCHYWEDINLKKIAGMFYISSGYLGQLFKKETGKYYNDFINGIRVEEAKRMLRDPKLSIADIAEKVGYKNTNHFYLHFKNDTGISPGDYRKQPS